MLKKVADPVIGQYLKAQRFATDRSFEISLFLESAHIKKG